MNRIVDILKAYQLIVAALILALGGIVTAAMATRCRYVPQPLPMFEGPTELAIVDRYTGEVLRADGSSVKK